MKKETYPVLSSTVDRANLKVFISITCFDAECLNFFIRNGPYVWPQKELMEKNMCFM